MFYIIFLFVFKFFPTPIDAEFNYPPTYYNPNYEYYNSPNNLRQTYNICPEDFYYYDYEPLIYNTENIDRTSSILNTIDNFLYNDKNNLTKKARRSSRKRSDKKFQAQQNSPIVNNIDGPFWQIFSQSYEKCCPLNKNRLKTNLVKNDAALHEQIFDSFSNQTHILFFQSQGMFAIIELFNQYQQFDTNSFNPYAVQVLSSSGFILITKRDFNGAPTITPIALTILLNAWPLLVIILIANAYAGIFIWFFDRAAKTYQFPKPFTHGTVRGMWWSYFLFTATSLAPKINVKTYVIRTFTVIWMMVSLVIVVIFIAMFTTSLTIYAINGESLNGKIIGINKYSTDIVWIKTENAVAVEYNSINDMFKDLDEQKLDYMLLDKTYANFYSKLINSKFYVMRQVERKRSFNVLLRGFNQEQLSCFQTTSVLISQLWIKSNLSFNANKIKDTSKYFNLTDELLYPQRNAILITAFIILSMLIGIGITWQTTCMKSTPGGSGAAASLAGSKGTMNRGPRGGTGPRGRPRSRTGLMSDSSMLGEMGPNGGAAFNNMLGGGEGGAGGGAQAAGGGGGFGRQIFDSSGITESLPSVRGLIPGGFLSPNTQLQDRSVKFNPLVHNFYYNNQQKSDMFDKTLYEKAMLEKQNSMPTFYNQENTNNEEGGGKVAWNQHPGLQYWNQFKSSDSGFNENFASKEALSSKPPNYNQNNSHDYQYRKSGAGGQSVNPTNYARIPSLQSSPAHTLTRVKYNPPILNPGYFNPHYDYNIGNTSRSDSPYKTNQLNITTVELPFNFPGSNENANGGNNQIKFKRLINYQRKGIVLNPSTNSVSNLYTQESNTDEQAEQNNNHNHTHRSSSTPPPTLSPQETLNNDNNQHHQLSTEITVKDDLEIQERNRVSSDESFHNNSLSNPATASLISNPTYKELPRNESFYLNEFSSVKL